jgi:hypothetical protein
MKIQELRLADFRQLIAAMPTWMHASRIQRKTWQDFLARPDAAGDALRALFGNADEIQISRGDLRQLAQEQSLDRFLMATVLWGYPTKMRGHEVALCANFDSVVGWLDVVRAKPVISDWMRQWQEVERILGYWLSTVTKWLTFLGVVVEGYPAQILDRVIKDVIENEVFAELTGRFDAANYPKYLALMQGEAEELGVPTENLEFFVYVFGPNIKPDHEAPDGIPTTTGLS